MNVVLTLSQTLLTLSRIPGFLSLPGAGVVVGVGGLVESVVPVGLSSTGGSSVGTVVSSVGGAVVSSVGGAVVSSVGGAVVSSVGASVGGAVVSSVGGASVDASAGASVGGAVVSSAGGSSVGGAVVSSVVVSVVGSVVVSSVVVSVVVSTGTGCLVPGSGILMGAISIGVMIPPGAIFSSNPGPFSFVDFCFFLGERRSTGVDGGYS